MENEMKEFTHIIKLKGNEMSYFATDLVEGADTYTFKTSSKKGETWEHTVAKNEVAEIKRKC